MPQNLLEIRNLQTYFYSQDGVAKAVDGVSYEIAEKETLGVVGESGCGKSVTAFSILQLIPNPPGKIVGGDIIFQGENLVEKNESAMRKIRGNRISMIFQEPMTSLNPIKTVGSQIVEAIRQHQNRSVKDAREIAIEALAAVGIPSPQTRIDEYPHQMSGGMKQRAMIAMAIVCRPSLLIADEPTTALDVTIQAQILDLLRAMQEKIGMSILLITHNLGVVAEMANRIAVMYAGKVVEYTDAKSLFDHPRHPYTHGLFRSIPNISEKKEKLEVIRGIVPSPLEFPSGCRFRNRCDFATEKCREEPPLKKFGENHIVACHYADKL